MDLIIGLGNPGPDYTHTRHNIGFLVIDHLAGRLSASLDKKKSQAHYGKFRLGDTKGWFLKPQTFMNDSGMAVSAFMHFYDIPANRIMIISAAISRIDDKSDLARNAR